MSKPRILHLLSQRPGRTGSGVFLKAMVREAARRGYSQHAIVAGPPDTSYEEVPPLGRDEVSVVAFPGPDAPFDVPGNSDVMAYQATVFSKMTEEQISQYLRSFEAAMRAALERFRPDIIHTHHLWLMTALARRVFEGSRVLTTSHNAELRQLVKAPHLAPRVVPVVRALDKICVLTPRSIHDTVERFGVAEDRIALTGAGYRDDLFFHSPEPRAALRERLRQRAGIVLPGERGEKVITFVGRLSTPKGVPFLLSAVRRLEEAGAPDFKLVLVGATGSGENGAEMDRLVRAAGPRVVHIGAVPEEVVAWVLKCSDLFVLPSLFEGLPLVMLEAAACGCPCVVSELPTVKSWVPRRWIDDRHFHLVPKLETTDADLPVAGDVPRFVDALASGIAGMLARTRTREDSETLAAELAGHSWSAVFERYEAVYRELLGSGHAIE
jgi:glycosyltransferase involved in cell wall biosynthesis